MRIFIPSLSRFAIVLLFMVSGCTKKENVVALANEQSRSSALTMFFSKLKSEKAKKIIKEASEDFDLVVAGKTPKNSKVDSATINGLTKYNGSGYKLRVVDTDGTVAGEYINIFGPIIEFDDPEFQLLEKQISDVRLYDHDQYMHLKGTK